MVTLITTDQQIMTGLQTADTEEDRSALIILHFMEWLCGNKDHNKPYPIVQHSWHPCTFLILFPSGRC